MWSQSLTYSQRFQRLTPKCIRGEIRNGESHRRPSNHCTRFPVRFPDYPLHSFSIFSSSFLFRCRLELSPQSSRFIEVGIISVYQLPVIREIQLPFFYLHHTPVSSPPREAMFCSGAYTVYICFTSIDKPAICSNGETRKKLNEST